MTYSTFAYLAGASAARHRFGSGSLRRSYRRGAIAKIYAPPTAQFGEVQAVRCAANITARLAGRPSHFATEPRGGCPRSDTVRRSRKYSGLKQPGFIAWRMWHHLYLVRIPTLAPTTRLFLEWNAAMFLPPNTSHICDRPEALLLRRPPGVYHLTASFPNYRSSESRPAEAGTEGVTATRKPLRTQAR